MQLYCASYWYKGQNVKQHFLATSKESVEKEVREGLAHLPEFQKTVRIKVKRDNY